MTFAPAWFGQPTHQSTMLAEAEREHFEQARDAVMDHLELAVVDSNGRRIKEREANAALKLLGRL